MEITTKYYRAMKLNHGVKRYVWEKPRDCFVKVNVDASFSHADKFGATGVVLRDNHGVFTSRSSCVVPHVARAPMAEARAL